MDMKVIISYILCTSFTLGSVQSANRDIKIGMLLSEKCCDLRSVGNKGSAVNIAYDQLRKDGIWPANTSLR